VPAPPEEDLDADAGVEDALQEPAGTSGRGGAGTGDGGRGDGGGRDGGERPSGAPLRGGNRAIGFLRASWAELQRVQWPDRRQVTQATAVVLGFVAIAGAYLGAADFVAKEIVEFVIG
jgi:preprotein translocase subunit SecE